MMRILLKTNLILILISAIVICIVARPITYEIVKSKSLSKNEESRMIHYKNPKELTVQSKTIKKAFYIELFNESGYMDHEEVSKTLHIVSRVIAMLGKMLFSLYLLTKMLSFHISFAYIKGWLKKVSQIACIKARVGFLLLKLSVKNELSNEYHLTTYTF